MRLFPAIAAALILVASSAHAEQMMPLGPSPDGGFAGVWRVIAAKSVPWVKPRALKKIDTPLLEYAIGFSQGVVKGPPPLGCPHALYSSGDSDPFGGKLKDKAMQQAVRLTQAGVTYRVVCGSVTRDFYMNDDADVVMAEGDVVYTLQRPTGMDPEQYEAGYSGPSFDCTKAKATGEKLICIDAALAKADKKLGETWRKLKQSVSAESFASFQSAQRGWLAHTTKICGGDVAMPDNPGDRTVIADCLSTEYGARADLLSDFKTKKSGALTIEPRVRFRTRATPVTEETDIYPMMSGGSQATAFNAFIAKSLKLNAWRMDDASLFRYNADPGAAPLYARRYYGVLRFDNRIVSLAFGTNDFVGGHDEEHYSSALTWDLVKSRPVKLDDVFVKDAKWKSFVQNFCVHSLQQQTADDGKTEADLGSSELESSIASDAHWIWGKDDATVTFTIFMDSGMPQEEYDVKIPYKLLKPYMKPDAPVL